MDKRSFQNETAFQVVMHLARRMLAEKVITGKEYRDFEQEMLRRYQPFSGPASASSTLRHGVRLEERNRFLASCWLIVEPPAT